MNQEVNTETKRKLAKIAGTFCALGGFCIGMTTGQAAGTSVVGAVIGFVVGYAGALISPLLGFGLILVSAAAFWHTYTVWAKPAPPKPPTLTVEESKAALKKLRARLEVPAKAQQSPWPSATSTPNKVP
jgi:hypothetical protein